MKTRKFKSVVLTLVFSTLLVAVSGCASSAKPSDGITDGTGKQTGDTTITTGNNTSNDTLANSDKVLPKYINPLTGLESDKDLSGIRPVAVSINNTSAALPSAGVSAADVILEISAEGGETRILMFALDYENLGVVGSVRSARHNMLDFTEDFGAIFVHAGGSDYAYEALKERKTNNIDGVNGYSPVDVTRYFYRDSARLSSMGQEHSLMITGEKITSAIKARKYDTKLSDNFKFPLQFVAYGTEFTPSGDVATNVVIPYSQGYRMQRLAYNSETNTYFRYHNIKAPYIDSNTNEQLQFTNVIILYMETAVITDDDKGRLDITVVGNGEGYYIYGGKSMPIKWTRPVSGAQMKLTDKYGKPLEINRGKTYLSIARTNMYSTTELNSKEVS